MDDSFVLTVLALDELKKFGYREVWIGAVSNPHWPRHGYDNFVIAAPKRKKGGWPALWSAERYLGKTSCGNGLKKADQSQKAHVHRMKPGHYRLEDGSWKLIQKGEQDGD